MSGGVTPATLAELRAVAEGGRSTSAQRSEYHRALEAYRTREADPDDVRRANAATRTPWIGAAGEVRGRVPIPYVGGEAELMLVHVPARRRGLNEWFVVWVRSTPGTVVSLTVARSVDPVSWPPAEAVA